MKKAITLRRDGFFFEAVNEPGELVKTSVGVNKNRNEY
jgi:hypothetical protein